MARGRIEGEATQVHAGRYVQTAAGNERGDRIDEIGRAGAAQAQGRGQVDEVDIVTGQLAEHRQRGGQDLRQRLNRPEHLADLIFDSIDEPTQVERDVVEAERVGTGRGRVGAPVEVEVGRDVRQIRVAGDRGIQVQVDAGIRVHVRGRRPRSTRGRPGKARRCRFTSFRARVRQPDSCGVCGVLFETLNCRKPSVAVAFEGSCAVEAHRRRVGAVHVEAVSRAQAEAKGGVEARIEAGVAVDRQAEAAQSEVGGDRSRNGSQALLKLDLVVIVAGRLPQLDVVARGRRSRGGELHQPVQAARPEGVVEGVLHVRGGDLRVILQLGRHSLIHRLQEAERLLELGANHRNVLGVDLTRQCRLE